MKLLKLNLPFLLILCLSLTTFSQSVDTRLQKIIVSENNRFLVLEDGTPFFWLADTAWELFHRCDREEVKMYLKKRAEQGFNVIQAVALAEIDGLNTPNSYGETPLLNNNPATPNEEYFNHVDFVVREAAKHGIYIALLPTWGDKLFKSGWGKGPEVFNKENAVAYGKWIGNRYKDQNNIIWVLGGDRLPREGSDDVEVWRQMAEGIVVACGGYNNALMTFHPQPTNPGGSSNWFHDHDWLDFNMHQTGHCANQPTYKLITHDYNLKPTKPTLDGEPLYEDHPNCFNAKELGYSVSDDIRRIMYWNVFAGGFGQTYGCHDVWQMFKNDKQPINGPLRPWPMALDLPGANMVKHLKHLMLSRPYLTRIPDQKMIVSSQNDDEDYVIATRDKNGQYAMIYYPTGKRVDVNLSEVSAGKIKTWWFDPRTGNAVQNQIMEKPISYNFTPPTSGKGHDWILVIDNAEAKYGTPGKE